MITHGEDKAYYLEAGGEITTLLSNFNTDFIFSATEDLLDNRTKYFSLNPYRNFVDELEIAFKDLLNQYPGDAGNINNTRNEVYNNIIEKISTYEGVPFLYDDDVNIYYLASVIFDLFVSRYDIHVFNFLYNFILSQKDFLYNELNKYGKVGSLAKSKDTSTLYNKKSYTDQKLAIINANLDKCIKLILSYNIDLKTMLSYTYTDEDGLTRLNFLMRYIDPQIDLFKILISPLVHNELLYPSLSIAIKLQIQRDNVPLSNSFSPVSNL